MILGERTHGSPEIGDPMPPVGLQPSADSPPGNERNGPLALRALLAHPLEVAMSTILITIVVVVFAQVVSRYLLYRSLSWSEELARYLLLWLAMLSAAYGVKTGSHFALVLVVNRFRPGLRNSVNLLVTLAIAAFLVLFVINGAQMTYSGLGRVGPGTRLPLAVPYASTVVGGTFMLYYVLRNGWNDLKHLLPWGARSEEEAG